MTIPPQSSRKLPGVSPVFVLFLLMLCAVPVALLDQHNFPYDDGAEHGAAVRELAAHPLCPGEPMLDRYCGKSARFVPSTLLIALCVRVTGTEVPTALKGAAIVFFAVFVGCVSLFARAYFHDRGVGAWAAVAVLFLWGTGWTGANAYMFSAILSTAWYPSVVAFSLALAALWCQLRYLESGRKLFAAGQLLAGSAAFVNHPLTGLFYLAGSVLLHLEKRGLDVRGLLSHSACVVGTALAASALWPYYDFLPSLMAVMFGGLSHNAADYRLTRNYLYSSPLVRMGPALAGVPVLVFFLRQRRFFFLWGGALLFGGIYAIGYFVQVSLVERFVFFAVFSLQMAFAGYCRKHSTGPFAGTRARQGVLLVCAVLMAGGVVLQAYQTWTDCIAPSVFRTPNVPFVRVHSPNSVHAGMARHFGPGDVVLTDIFTGWSIPVYTGARVVALLHTPPHVPDNHVRVLETNNFFNATRPIEEKKRLLEKYAPTYIVLNHLIMGLGMEPVLRDMGCRPVVRTTAYTLYQLPCDRR